MDLDKNEKQSERELLEKMSDKVLMKHTLEVISHPTYSHNSFTNMIKSIIKNASDLTASQRNALVTHIVNA